MGREQGRERGAAARFGPAGWRPRRWRRSVRRELLLLLILGLVVGTIRVGESALIPSGARRAAANAGASPTSPVSAPSPPPVVLVTAGHRPSTQGCVAGQPPAIAWTYPVVDVPPSGATAGEVALTFDDGPSATYTPAILAALRRSGAQATFFVIGSHARAHPDLLRRERAAGDAIGNHTFDHPVLKRLAPGRVSDELSKGTAAIADALGDHCVWLFRPPYGLPSWSAAVANQVRQAGQLPVLWDVEAADWQRLDARVIARRIIARLHPGAIVLLHDGAPDNEVQDRSQTAAAVPLILAALKARGLRAVTLPQLLFDAGVARQAAPATPAPMGTAGPGE